MSEHGFLHNGLPRPYRFEKVPEMRLFIIVGWAGVCNRFGHKLVTRFGIVLLVPIGFVGCAHRFRESLVVIAWSGIDAALRSVGEIALANFEQALRAHKPRHLGGLGSEREAYIHRHLAIFEDRCL